MSLISSRSYLPWLAAAFLLPLATPEAQACEDCPEVIPTDCLTMWQAYARGYLQVASDGSIGEAIKYKNSGPYAICLDYQVLYTSDGSQTHFMDVAAIDAGEELAAGTSLSMYYGSWTTANGYYYPYYGNYAWWCVESSQYAAAGATYDYYGEQIPDTLAHFANDDTDEDGDGKLDRQDWAGSYGVQANYNIWSYQSYHSILTAGKVATVSGPAVDVTLYARNIGYNAGTGTLYDILPAGWTASDFTVAPSSTTLNGDGTTTLTWSVSVAGTGGGTTVYAQEMGYTLSRDCASDLPYLELPLAYTEYFDGESWETSLSLPAAAYNIDGNGDGIIDCAEEEICDGIDNDLDCAIDDGLPDADADGICDGMDVEECDGADNDGDGQVDEGFDADGDGFADCAEECLVQERFCSAEDGQTLLDDGSGAVLTYDGNTRWTAAIDGAAWIWDEYWETNPQGDEIQSFFRTFTVQEGTYDMDATLEIGADNSYHAWLNGTEVAVDPTETNYFAPTDIWDISSALAVGSNSLEWEVWNWAQPGGNELTNPGGLLYCVDLSYAYEMDGEICDGVDNDCDGLIDDEDDSVSGLGAWYADVDGDGYGDGAVSVTACDAPSGFVDNDGDCDDSDAAVFPGADEFCNGVDDDCDGLVDEDALDAATWYADADGDGYGNADATVVSCNEPTGYVGDDSDCNDGAAATYPGAPETCDAADNDCDGMVDEDAVDMGTWYADADGDGYGDADAATTACTQPVGSTTDTTDCDDGSAAVNPGATEVCNGLDDDCDGYTDEGEACLNEDCAELVPDECLTIWQAHARGWLSIESAAAAVVTFTNVGPYDICIDEQVLYTSDLTQAFYVEDAVASAATEVGPGDSFNVYYGSWTTANGYYAPYAGYDAWWCVENGQMAAGGAIFDYFGEEIPAALAYYTSYETDEDGDGVADLLDWAGSYGVQANYNIWDYQAGHAVLTAGKVAEDDAGDVLVTLVVRNLGYDAGSGTLYDTVPAGWTYESASPTPDSVTEETDGSTTLAWSVSLDGTAGGLTLDVVEIGYTISSQCSADTPYLELDSAFIVYDDGEGEQSSQSMPAAVYNIDGDNDGAITCAEEEICDGIDNDLDCQIDEGLPDSDMDGTCDELDVEECDGVDNDGDGEIDEDFDADGDGWTTCGIQPACDVLFDLYHLEGTYSDPYEYASYHSWGYAADLLVENDMDWASNSSQAIDASLLAGYDAAVIAEPLTSFSTDEVTALVDYVYGGGGLLLTTDFNPEYMNQIASGFGVSYYGYSDLIGWVRIDEWDNTHPVSDGIDNVFWAYGSTMAVSNSDARVLGTYEGRPVYTVLEYGAGRIVFAADNELFAAYGLQGYYDPAPGTEKDNEALWLQTMGWLTGCQDDTVAPDCDDADASINPGADELCDGLDNNCDGIVDDDAVDMDTWYADGDGDGYGDAASTTTACDLPSGYTDDANDCDDGSASVYPGADEYCNGVDDDCDGAADEDAIDMGTWFVDADGDGFGGGTTVTACEQPAGSTDDSTDCDDGSASVYPGADELCNGVDDDCDGSVDEDAIDMGTWYVDADGDGFGGSSTVTACEQPAGTTDDGTDCDDGVAEVYPGADEFCNDVDDDCDGSVDEDAVDMGTWYADADGDGFGDAAAVVTGCEQPSGSVDDTTDCDDTDPGVNPDALEICDSIDNDCDGDVDEDNLGEYVTFGTGTATEVDGVPFEAWGLNMYVQYKDGISDIPTASYDLSGEVADRIHLLEFSAYADNVEQGMAVGWVQVEYTDGTSDGIELVIGENTAEWAYDRPEIQTHLQHDKVAPAYSWNTTVDSSYAYDGHLFYVAFDLQSKPLADLQLDLYEAPYTEAGYYGYSYDDWFHIGVVGITLQGANDTWYADDDGDGYGDAADVQQACEQPSGYVADDSDCDDDAADVNPGADEYCDGVDDDCDGLVDEDAVDMGTWYADGDGDGYGDAGNPADACDLPSGYTEDDSDCDDGSASVYPGADEFCNGLDDDCDGLVDTADDNVLDALTWYEDADGDGFGGAVSMLACEQPSGWEAVDGDCDDDVAAAYPGADEVCDDMDNDCDGAVDEDALDMGTWYTDADGDGYGDGFSPVQGCEQPAGTVDDTTDCDDNDAGIYPDALEICDSVDNDCDGAADELGCGEDDCPELVPEVCLSVWEAHARGWLQVASSSSGTQVTFTNLGPYDICIDEQALYTSDATQALYVDQAVIDLPATITTGEAFSVYYGSWTTDNGAYSPYLGEDAWWCVENGQFAAGGAGFDFYGEEIPAVLAWFTVNATDEDGDGVTDLDDWAGSYGVQANYNIWDYQATHPVLTAGKVAEASGTDVLVTLVSRNVGYDAGNGTLYDVVPAGWGYDLATVEPDSVTAETDGSLTLAWAITLDGTGGGLTVDVAEISYALYRDAEADSDAPYLALDAAWVVYEDGDGEQTSTSLPAAAYDVDVNGDGVVDCASEEICDGVDNDLDGYIDEDFDADGDGWTTCEGDCDDGDANVNPGLEEGASTAPYAASSVVDYSQGAANNGSAISSYRSDATAGLEHAAADYEGGFYSLGFEGWVVVGFDLPVLNGDGDDLMVYEKTYTACSSYAKESADVYAWDDEAAAWLLLGEASNLPACDRSNVQSTFDLGDLTETSQIMLVDTTDGALFEATADGFDLNGVYALHAHSLYCDGVDNDCDGLVDEGMDSDADGIADCFDSEECDGLDNNGDGAVDEGFDSDVDGIADCFDTEECDGLDNDGDGAVDEGFDSDADGIADCFDWEDCDGMDNDGDGLVDEDTSDVDADGLCDQLDSEECDGQDNDGDGEVDEDTFDVDGDGLCDALDSEDCDGIDNTGEGDVDEGCPGSVSGVVYLDLNQDGEQGCEEPGIEGAVVLADGPDCDGDGLADTWEATTDEDGIYVLVDLCVGDWTVTFDAQEFDQAVTTNPVELSLSDAEDTVVDFGVYREFHYLPRWHYMFNQGDVTPFLPITVGNDTLTSFWQVRNYLGASACDLEHLLGSFVLVAKLNDYKYGIGAFPLYSEDCDCTWVTIGDAIEWADAALRDGVSTDYGDWIDYLRGLSSYVCADICLPF